MSRKKENPPHSDLYPDEIIHDLERRVVELEKLLDDTRQAQNSVMFQDSPDSFPIENPYPVLRISGEGKILFANKASSILLDDWGCKIGNISPSDLTLTVKQVLDSKAITEIEIMCAGATYICTFVPIPANNYVNIYALDVSKLKQTEVELRTTRDQLEQRVQERTSELVNANQELRQNEELLSQILETLPVGVLITNENGKIILANPESRSIWAGAQYVGIEQYGKYKGRWFNNGKPIEPEEWAAARAIRKGETSLNEEIEIESFDGEHKIINNSAVPIRSGGKVIGAIVLIRDITQRKQGEKALMQANELLEMVFSSVDIHIAYMDRDFNFLRVNRAYAWSDQHEPEFYPGKNYFDLFPDPENYATFKRVVETRVPYTVYEKPYRYPNSPERGVTYWDWSLQPVKDEKGVVQGLIHSLVDVTKRKVDDDLIHQGMERASLLGELSRTLAEAGPDYQAVLGAITNAITRLLGDTCVIRLISEDGHWLELAAVYDKDPQIIQVLRHYNSTVHISVDEGLSGLAFQKGEGILISPGEEPSKKAGLSLLYGPLVDQIKSMMTVPVRVRGGTIGVISLSRRLPADAYTQDDLKFLQSLADRASMAIVNARLYRDLETSLRAGTSYAYTAHPGGKAVRACAYGGLRCA